MGSGSMAAMAVLETEWKPNLTEAEAVDLARNAILSGIWNDLGSGSNVDLAVIRATPDGKSGETQIYRNLETPNAVAPLRAQVTRPAPMNVPSGATKVLSSKFTPSKHPIVVAPAAVAMES